MKAIIKTIISTVKYYYFSLGFYFSAAYFYCGKFNIAFNESVAS